jgi:hypothetical protein
MNSIQLHFIGLHRFSSVADALLLGLFAGRERWMF